MVKIKYRFIAKPEGEEYKVQLKTASYPFEKWQETGTLTLTKDEWEGLRDMLGRFSISVNLQEPQLQ